MSNQKLKIETHHSEAIKWCYKITNTLTKEVLAEEAGYYTEVIARVEAQNKIKELLPLSLFEVEEKHVEPTEKQVMKSLHNSNKSMHNIKELPSFKRVPAHIKVEDSHYVPFSAHPMRNIKK